MQIKLVVTRLVLARGIQEVSLMVPIGDTRGPRRSIVPSSGRNSGRIHRAAVIPDRGTRYIGPTFNSFPLPLEKRRS